MDAPAGSESSGGRRKTKPRHLVSKLTPLQLEDSDSDNDLCIGVLTLDKPSGVPDAPNWERQVCLDLTDPSDKFSLSILTDIHHKNILHLESALSVESSVKFCVEKYSRESLYRCIYRYRFLEDNPKLQNLIRQVVEGIEELRLNNLYHGNLSIYTTYYVKDTKLVKLAHFKEKGDNQSLIEAQFGDWHGLGNMVEEISTLAKRRLYDVSCLLDDLACQLKKISPPKMLSQVKDETLDHVYFWNRDRRSSFYTYGILRALHQDYFKKMVNNLDFIPEDWDKNASVLLAAMNRYRKKIKVSDYNGGRHQYVVYVSGAYTHEEELDIEIDVDSEIELESPLLCLELVRIVRQLGYNV